MEPLLKPLRSVLRSTRSLLWHRGHWQEARGVLETIESERGPTDPALLADADRYARDVLGWRGYAPWLRVYAAIAGEFKEGWIPDNYFGHVVLPAIDMPYGGVSHYKSLTRRLFETDALPDVLYLIRGSFFAPDPAGFRPVADGDVASTLFARSDRVIFKADLSLQGKDIMVLDHATFTPELLAGFRSGVFQTFVDQHVDFEPVSPQSVATLRLTTVHEGGGKVSVRQAFMRVGRVDDLHVKSTSSLRIGVDVDVGRFHPTGYTKTWATMEKHPDTGAVFGDHSVPGFDACRRLVEELHAQVPHVTCVGWDLAVDRDAQPVLLEWNGTHNGIKFSEAVQGPCFLGLGWETLWRQRPADA